MSDTVNWQSVLEELKDCMTLKELSARTGIPSSNLSDLKTGKVREPLHGAGQRILSIHRREMARIERQRAREANKGSNHAA